MEPTKQAPDTRPPKRRRRRWLIVAFVLVLLASVAWWEWPRGDARFVGKWLARVPLDDAYVDAGKVIGVVTLSPNGLGGFDSDYYRDYKSFSWAVVDDRLRIGHRVPHWCTPLADLIHQSTRKHFGRLFIVSQAEFTAERNDDGTIALDFFGGQPWLPDPFVLTRIPE